MRENLHYGSQFHFHFETQKMGQTYITRPNALSFKKLRYVGLSANLHRTYINLHNSGVIVADEGVIRGVLNVTITSAKVSFSVFKAVETKCFDR